jgi:hypothetical protein
MRSYTVECCFKIFVLIDRAYLVYLTVDNGSNRFRVLHSDPDKLSPLMSMTYI